MTLQFFVNVGFELLKLVSMKRRLLLYSYKASSEGRFPKNCICSCLACHQKSPSIDIRLPPTITTRRTDQTTIECNSAAKQFIFRRNFVCISLEMARDYDYLLKILLVGDSDVGKHEILSGLDDASSERPFCSGNSMNSSEFL